mgnify:CR=1 FL=1|jgi:hypothetical protein
MWFIKKLKKLLSHSVSFDVEAETYWSFQVIRNGKVIAESAPVHNVTTNAGLNVARAILHQAAHGGIAGFDKLTVGSTDYTPAAGDTSLTGEVNADGLERVSGTYSNEAGTGAWKLETTFTYTGSGVTVYTGAVFNSASGATMMYAAKFASSATLVNGDQLRVIVTGSVAAA